MEQKDVYKMTKAELQEELKDIRVEYGKLRTIQDIDVMLGRMVCLEELEEIKAYVEKVYEQTVVKQWGFWHGMRDNIVDMANNLAENVSGIELLQYMNTVMYDAVLSGEPEAAEGLHTTTDSMRSALLEHLQEKGGIA